MFSRIRGFVARSPNWESTRSDDGRGVSVSQGTKLPPIGRAQIPIPWLAPAFRPSRRRTWLSLLIRAEAIPVIFLRMALIRAVMRTRAQICLFSAMRWPHSGATVLEVLRLSQRNASDTLQQRRSLQADERPPSDPWDLGRK